MMFKNGEQWKWGQVDTSLNFVRAILDNIVKKLDMA